MPYNTEIFRVQFRIVKRFVYHLIYYHQLLTIYRKLKLKSEFWTHTINSHILQAAIYWCMVFGRQRNNPTHWRNVLKGDVGVFKANFYKILFKNTGFNSTKWKKYQNKIVRFRNKYVAHRELKYGQPVPDFTQALKVAYVYDQWIRELISPDIFVEPPLKKTASKLEKSLAPLLRDLISQTKKYNKDTEQVV